VLRRELLPVAGKHLAASDGTFACAAWLAENGVLQSQFNQPGDTVAKRCDAADILGCR
jgi:hypothetical protein